MREAISNPLNADGWADQLGLLPVPVFSGDLAPRFVMLNGPTGNFCLDFTGAATDNRAVAWSSDVGHYVSVSGDDIHVQRWDSSSAVVEKYSTASVMGKLSEFHNYLEKTQPRYERSVVPHAIRVFRLLRGSLREENGTSALRAFLTLLACATDGSSRGDLNLQQWGLSAKESEAAGAISNSDWEFLGDDLVRGRLNERLVLNPRLLLRHAAGQLFQEAHYEASVAPQLSLPGFSPQPARVRENVSSSIGVHFTPPSLARMVVEQSLLAMDLKGKKLKILDPACGSGEFLRECLRQLRLLGFKGHVELIGQDISEAACAMAKFVLTWEMNTDAQSVSVDIRCADSLSSGEWPSEVDLIVMNPPFVSYERLSPWQLASIKSTLGALAKGRVDLSAAFLWKAVRCVGNSGIVATLIPASFLEANATASIRAQMRSFLSPHFIARLGSQILFRDVLVDTAALVLQVEELPRQDGSIAFWADHRLGSTATGIRALRRATRTRQNLATPVLGDGYSIYVAPLVSSQNWSPRSYEAWEFLSRLRSLDTVKELFHVHTGARPGHLPAFVLDKASWNELPRKEQRYFRPAVVNESIAFGFLRDVKYVFYPYGKNVIATEQKLRSELANYYEGVLLPNRAALLKRASKRDPSRWWEMSESRVWQHSNAPKLVSVYFGKAGSFAYDATGEFVVVQGFAWLPKPKLKVGNNFHPYLALAYLAILNSPIVNNLLTAVSNPVQGGQWDLSARFVEKIAIPNLANSENSSLLEALSRFGFAISRGAAVDQKGLLETVNSAFGVS